jgi:hypothetical protein
MSDSEFFSELAKRCRRLARSCFDLGVAGELREMAHEIENRTPDPEPGVPAPQRARQRPRD